MHKTLRLSTRRRNRPKVSALGRIRLAGLQQVFLQTKLGIRHRHLAALLPTRRALRISHRNAPR